MARKRKTDEQVEQELGMFLTVAYVLDALGHLPPEKRAALDGIPDAAVKWDDSVGDGLRDGYGLDAKGIRALHATCAKRMGGKIALLFILRGVGIPEPTEEVKSIVGTDGLHVLEAKLLKAHPKP
jgi:hypothetical protein